MTVLDTFYLLFKSDASDAKKGVSDLEKQIDVLKEKGRKRTEEESKSLKESTRRHKELSDEIKNQQKQTELLGGAFVKMVESAVAAGAAVLTFSGLKSGVMNAAAFNSSLQVQSKILGVNTQDMLAYGAAVEAAGGSVEGFQSALQSTFKAASNAGLAMPQIDVWLARLRTAIAGKESHEQARILGLNGVGDPGMIALLQQSNEEFAKSIAAAKEHAQVTEADAKAAREFEKEWSQTKQSFTSVFTVLGTQLLPLLTVFNEGLQEFAGFLRENRWAADAAAVGVTALSVAFGLASIKIVASLVGIGGAAGGAAAAAGGLFAVLGRLGAVGGIFAGSAALVYGSSAAGTAVGTWLGHQINKARGVGDENGVLQPQQTHGGASGSSPANGQRGAYSKESYQFWLAQGYSPAQAAGLVANEQAESGFNPGSIGDGGLARGSFQWHPDRVAKILAATGIDVRTAGHTDQLKAAAWELRNRGDDALLRAAATPEDAANIVNRKFEVSGDYSMKRAMIAAQIGQSQLSAADASPFNSAGGASGSWGDNSRSIAVKVDAINVHTQATDADGIAGAIGQSLQSHFRTTISNWDDGVMA